MRSNISPIIQAKDLLQLYKNNDVVIVHAGNGETARKNYEEKHIEGALFVDLNSQLADIPEDPAQGGRHPLPAINSFAETLSSVGISPASHVIIYDDQNGSNAAARFWWMLRSAGYDKVQVLDGGFKQAVKFGLPITAAITTVNKTALNNIEAWKLPIATMDQVEKATAGKDHTIIDVRSKERYNGEQEPIDLVAGHIPGAINIPFTENLDDEGCFLPPAELKTKYDKILEHKKMDNVIVHCGSGVTACHTLLAMAYAGLAIPKLYVGSWSEWSGNNKPMITK